MTVLHSSIVVFFFEREREFTKFVSEEIGTARSRPTSRRRRIPMPASPRRRARCNCHKARISCCLVQLSTGGLGPPGEIVSLPACTQRKIRRVPLERAAWIRWLSVVISERGRSTEQLSQIQKESVFRATQRTGPTDKPLPSRPQKISSPLASASPLVLCNCTASRLASCVRGARLLQPGDDSSFFAETQQHWRACIRRI